MKLLCLREWISVTRTYFLAFLVEYGARVEKARPLPRKKIEFYGDSVTAGEVSEAQNYAGMPDPSSEGEYNNAYFSYAWATARRLHAAVHLVAAGRDRAA